MLKHKLSKVFRPGTKVVATSDTVTVSRGDTGYICHYHKRKIVANVLIPVTIAFTKDNIQGGEYNTKTMLIHPFHVNSSKRTSVSHKNKITIEKCKCYPIGDDFINYFTNYRGWVYYLINESNINVASMFNRLFGNPHFIDTFNNNNIHYFNTDQRMAAVKNIKLIEACLIRWCLYMYIDTITAIKEIMEEVISTLVQIDPTVYNPDLKNQNAYDPFTTRSANSLYDQINLSLFTYKKQLATLKATQKASYAKMAPAIKGSFKNPYSPHFHIEELIEREELDEDVDCDDCTIGDCDGCTYA